MNVSPILPRLLPILFIFSLISCSDQIGHADKAIASDAPASSHLPKRVFFVGNSFTYFNGGIDGHLRNLLAHGRLANNSIIIAEYTRPNQTFAGHLHDENLIKLIRNGNWDVVILQAASYEATEARTKTAFIDNGMLLASIVRESGAKPIFFMTWPYHSQPNMLGGLESGYRELSQKAGATVIPVGTLWERSRTIWPDMPLYSDERHPSLTGTYLAACIFYAALYQELCADSSYDAGIDQKDSEKLQSIVTITETNQAIRAFNHPAGPTK